MPPDSTQPCPETVAALVRSRAGDPNAGLHFEGHRWTWAEVVTEMEVRAAFLTQILTGQPPHVGILLDNVPEYLFTLGGAALSGTVVVGINPTRRGAELARDIRHTDCQAIITDSDHLARLDGLDLGAAADRIVVVDALGHQARMEGVAARAGRRWSQTRDPTTCSCSSSHRDRRVRPRPCA